MSDRDLEQKNRRFEAWMKDIDGRLTTVERRPLQGAISLESLDVGPAAVSATRADPLLLKGVKNWSKSVENLGNPRENCLVTRDETSRIIDLAPVPFTQFFGGPSTSVVGSTLTFMNLSTCGVSSGPFPDAQSYSLSDSCLIAPTNGVYFLMATVAWVAVADTTSRRLGFAISTNGGVTYADLAYDIRGNNNSAVETLWQTATFASNLSAGDRFKLTLVHRSATTPLGVTLSRFQMWWLRANSSVPA